MTVFAGAILVWIGLQATPPSAESLSGLDGIVAASDDPTPASAWREMLRRGLDQANRASTAEWHARHGRDDWQAWKSERVQRLRKSLGQWPTPAVPVRYEITGDIEGDGFRIQNLLIESRPDLWITANLYRPSRPGASMPALLISHSHHTPKHHGELQDMGMTWARAGCLVLVPDHLGHGERRQHPFQTAADFTRPYAVGRQDYYSRYDAALQLRAVGDSLAGWMAWDLMRGADVLLAQPGVDPRRLILLGAVAGGGDPAAITGALDERFAMVVPFNFGGPQPESRYPLPADSEQTFGYAGSGSWESTRNLARSAADGFLPWVIVGSIAPRRLIYGHEFRWDRDHDPVWKRLQTLYEWHGVPDHLAYTHGRGELKGQPPEATHCTHIGAAHRVGIHAALHTAFGIDVTPETEYSRRVPAATLQCWTADTRHRLKSASLAEFTQRLAAARLQEFRETQQGLPPEQRRLALRAAWTSLLGVTGQAPGILEPERAIREDRRTRPSDPPGVERWLITTESGVTLPLLTIAPTDGPLAGPILVAVCSQGKQQLLKSRAREIAERVRSGTFVCLVDPRGLGECHSGGGRGRRSQATADAATALMIGRPIPGQQLQDLRTVLAWLRQQPVTAGHAIELWGESLAAPNPDSTVFQVPRDDDSALPALSEPQAPLLVVLAGLFEDDIAAITATRGLIGWQSLLTGPLVLTTSDSVPGALTAGDIADLLAAQRSVTRVTWAAPVDGRNQRASETAGVELLKIAGSVSLVSESELQRAHPILQESAGSGAQGRAGEATSK